MPDTAGSLLLRAGLVNEAQLMEAEWLRQRDGGTLGECLIRLEALDEDQLVEFFHNRLMVPRIEPEQFERVPRKVIESVPADMAAEFRVFPVDIDPEGTLTLAMADPADAAVADEVGFFTDRFCQRAVAHPSLIRAAITHYYGVEIVLPPLIPPPVVPVSAVPVHEDAVSGILHAAYPEELEIQSLRPGRRDDTKPLREGMEHAARPTPTPLPEPVPPPVEELPEPGPDGLGEGDVPITTEAMDDLSAEATLEPPPEEPVLLTKVKEREPAPVPPPPPLTDGDEMFDLTDVSESGEEKPPEREEPILLTRRVVGLPPPAQREEKPPAPAPPDPPLAPLRNTHTRDEIARLLLNYLARLAPRTALFVVRHGMLVGFDGAGAELDVEALKRVQIPMDVSSLFRDVIQSRLPYRGPLGTSLMSRQFARDIGELRGDVMLFPVAVRDKVVAIMYADGITAPLPDATLHAVAREAGRAYERLILAKKH